MANIKSQLKRIKTNAKATERNKAVKSELRTWIRKFQSAAKSGDATAAEDGHYQIVLGSDVTSKLVAGSDKIEVAVVPIPVAIPAFTSMDFKVGQ